ncbi:hypothetical protein BLA29_004472 [Euroglyphus maynei]|uniref:Uncharacterized protein n=1 Tax=Euroglyphus maynei TaxID=6958 RepID=A0A1Y3BRG7_EURMA|nr:hypothetical protein BLA29_004472 [Euroglyphus maynei]
MKRHHKMFERLQKEIDENSEQLTRFISIIIAVSTMVTTYATYLLFMTRQSFVYQCLYCQIGMAQVNTFSVIITGCDKIQNY